MGWRDLSFVGGVLRGWEIFGLECWRVKEEGVFGLRMGAWGWRVWEVLEDVLGWRVLEDVLGWRVLEDVLGWRVKSKVLYSSKY